MNEWAISVCIPGLIKFQETEALDSVWMLSQQMSTQVYCICMPKNLYCNGRFSHCTVPFIMFGSFDLMQKSQMEWMKIKDMLFVSSTTCLTREWESLISCSRDFLLLSHTAETKIFPFAKKLQHRESCVFQAIENKQPLPYSSYISCWLLFRCSLWGYLPYGERSLQQPKFPWTLSAERWMCLEHSKLPWQPAPAVFHVNQISKALLFSLLMELQEGNAVFSYKCNYQHVKL